MDISTNGDQVAAHYAARYAALFMIIRNGTPHRAPVAGDVLSMSAVPGFDSAAGGHTAVVQASSVNAAGDGTVTIVEENALRSGVEVLPVSGWSVRYGGFPYLEWLTAAGMIITTPTLPTAQVSRAYSATLTATGGAGPYRWAVTSGALPGGLALSASGVLSGTVAAASAGGGDAVRAWPFTVTATDARRAVAAAPLELTVAGSPEVFSADATAGSLRDARWTGTAWDFTTLDGAGSALPGHTSDDVGTASSAVEIGGQPMVFYSDATTGSLRAAWRSGGGWRFETLDGPGSALAQHTWHHVGSTLGALTANGRPQVYYYDSSAAALHRAWWDGTRWLFLTIDGSTSRLAGHTPDQVGSAISATLGGDQPQVFYADATGQSLRHAWLTAAGWRFETLDGPGAATAGHTADHVGSAVGVTQMNGNSQVYYYDATRQALRHAWRPGSAWQFETLDGAGSVIAGHGTDHVGATVSVTTMSTGPQVFYADASRGSLRHAWWAWAAWHFETLDGPGSTLPGHTGHSVGSHVAVTLY